MNLSTHKGFALMLAIFMILAFAVLGMASLSLMAARLDIATRNLNSVQAYYIAEGARQYFLEYVVNWDTNFSNNTNPQFTKTLGSGNFVVSYVSAGERAATVRFRATIASPQGDISRSLRQDFDGHPYSASTPPTDTNDLAQNLQYYAAYFGSTAAEVWNHQPSPFAYYTFDGNVYSRAATLTFHNNSCCAFVSFGRSAYPAALFVDGNVVAETGSFFYNNPDTLNLCCRNYTHNDYQNIGNAFSGNIRAMGNVVMNDPGCYYDSDHFGSIYTAGSLTNGGGWAFIGDPMAADSINELIYVAQDVINSGTIGDSPNDQLHYKGTLDPIGTINAAYHQDLPGSPGFDDDHYGYANCLPSPPLKPLINTNWDPTNPTNPSYSYFAKEISIAQNISSSNEPGGLYLGNKSFSGDLDLAGKNRYVKGDVTIDGDITGTPANIVATGSITVTRKFGASRTVAKRISLISGSNIDIGMAALVGYDTNDDEGAMLFAMGTTNSNVAIAVYQSAIVKGRMLTPANADTGAGRRNVIGIRRNEDTGYRGKADGLIYTQSIGSSFGEGWGSIFSDEQARTINWDNSPPTYGTASSLTYIIAHGQQGYGTKFIPLCVKGLYDITRTNLREE
ncbi:MAG: hypothetical protein V1674_01210 [Candidatus Omnitrophota bacterium]